VTRPNAIGSPDKIVVRQSESTIDQKAILGLAGNHIALLPQKAHNFRGRCTVCRPVSHLQTQADDLPLCEAELRYDVGIACAFRQAAEQLRPVGERRWWNFVVLGSR